MVFGDIAIFIFGVICGTYILKCKQFSFCECLPITKKIFYLFFIAAICMALFYAVYGHRYIYADGAYLIYKMPINPSENFYIPRGLGFFLTQFMPFLAIKLTNIHSYQILCAGLTFNSYVVPIIFWFISLYLLRKHEVLQIIYAITFLIVFFGPALLIWNQHQVLNGVIACTSALLVRDSKFSIKSMIGLIFLLTLHYKVYETAFAIMPIYIILIIYRIMNEKNNIYYTYFFIICILLCIYLMYYNLDNIFTINYVTTDSMLRFAGLRNALFYISCIVSLYFTMRIIYNIILVKKNIVINLYNIICTLTPLFIICLLFIERGKYFSWSYNEPYISVEFRNIACLLMVIVVLIITINKIFIKNLLFKNFKVINLDYLIIILLTILIISNDIKSSINNRNFVHREYDIVNNNTDIISIHDTDLLTRSGSIPYAWGWTFQFVSAVLADRQKTAIITWPEFYDEHEKRYIPRLVPGLQDTQRPPLPGMVPWIKGWYWHSKPIQQ
jgi:hypothetical protein